MATNRSQAKMVSKGPYIKDVRKIFGIFDPLPPLVSILDQSIVLKSRNLPYCVRIWATPSLPLSSDVICEWPLTEVQTAHIASHFPGPFPCLPLVAATRMTTRSKGGAVNLGPDAACLSRSRFPHLRNLLCKNRNARFSESLMPTKLTFKRDI